MRGASAGAQVTYLGHACVLIEMGGARILMDPWLVGPCQANGWWHMPAAAATPEALGGVDYIMVSHVHDDHFHLPTLERLPRSATAIVPYGLNPWIADSFRDLGFAQVIEIDHEVPLGLPGGIQPFPT